MSELYTHSVLNTKNARSAASHDHVEDQTKTKTKKEEETDEANNYAQRMGSILDSRLVGETFAGTDWRTMSSN